MKNKEELEHQIAESNKVGDKILILTDPLCTLDVREKIFRDVIKMYEKEGSIFIKPHPRDELDYRKLFPEYPQFDATVPMEMLNFFPGTEVQKSSGSVDGSEGAALHRGSGASGTGFHGCL